MRSIGFDARLTYYRRGGIAAYMQHLLAALAELAPSEQIKVLHNFRAAEAISPFPRINTITPCHHRFESSLLGLELLPRRFDLFHSPDFIPPRLGARKYVITVHDLAFLITTDILTQDAKRYYAGQIGRAVQQADAIIAVSAATKKDIMRLLNVPGDKIHVIWEGVSQHFRVLEGQIKLPYDLPREYLLFVGTLEPRKNLVNLLNAYSTLPDAPPLVLAGAEGWLAEPIFEAMQPLGERVIWLQEVAYADLPALYNRATIHLLPSSYEGFGFPPLEAMACGTPTLISDRGALREVGGEAAYYVDPDDVESIADGIQTLLQDEALRHELRQRGLAHVKQFSWAQAAQQTYSLYQSLLD